MPAAGKSTVAQILQNEFGFNWIRTRDVVKGFAAEDTIVNLQSTGERLASGIGAENFCRELFKRIEPDRSNVIDALRPVEHWRRIRDEYGTSVSLVSIVAPRTLRERRSSDGGREESLRERDEHRVEAEIPALIEESTFSIVNQDYLEFRVAQLVTFLEHVARSRRSF